MPACPDTLVSIPACPGTRCEVVMRYFYPITLLLSWTCVAGPAAYADTAMPNGAGTLLGNVVPGMSVTAKPVKSMYALRYKDMAKQEQDFTCGAAALATLLQGVFGRTMTEHDIIEDMLRNTDEKLVKERGFSLLDMKAYVERNGLRGRGYKIDRASLLTVKIPVITLQVTRGYPHFVVIKKVYSDTVFLADPALGHRQVPLDEFLEGWNGIVFAVLGDGLNADSALVQSSKSIALDTRAGILTRLAPQQKDFGLLGMDAF